MTFHLLLVHDNLVRFGFAERPHFGKELPTRLAVCSHCILSICNFSVSRFGFEGGVWFLIAPVSVHCLLVS